MKVLLIEDDRVLGESLKEFLQSHHVSPEWLEDEREFEDYLRVNTYDVIVIDLMLKYLKGEDVLRKMRAKGIGTPILVLTAKQDISDKETCFNLGADDYLTKPFDPKELVLRLKSLSVKRRIQRIMNIGNVKVDLDAEVLYRNGKETRLSRKEWGILSILIKNRGRIVGTETILCYAWGDHPVGDETLRTYIKNLRKILPENAISTYKGRGYKLN